MSFLEINRALGTTCADCFYRLNQSIYSEGQSNLTLLDDLHSQTASTATSEALFMCSCHLQITNRSS